MRYLTFIFLLFSLSLQGQYILPSEEIDAIGYDKRGNYFFYKQLENGNYQQYDLAFEIDTLEGFYRPHWKNLDNERSLKEVLEDYKLLPIEDIRPSKYTDFEGKTFHTSHDALEGFKDRHAVFQLLNPYMARIYSIAYTKRRFGFGKYTLREDDQKEKWRPQTGEYYNVILLDFGKGRYAYACSPVKYLRLTLVPLTNKDLLLSRKGPIDIKHTLKTDFLLDNTIEYFYSSHFFKVAPHKEKYKLYNSIKNDLLGKSFDTIFYNNAFIVTKDKGETNLYNTFLKKIDTGKIKAVYFRDEQAEVLNEKGVFLYDITGKTGTLLKEITYICGSVRTPSPKEHILVNTPLKLSVYNGEQPQWMDMMRYVCIKKGDKEGLFVYSALLDEPNVRDTREELLPFDYDKIELKQEEKLIYIYKDNKVAIYPKTNMFYDYLEKTSPSFYRFERGGKRGYLDIHTFEEYLDNK